MERFAHCFVHRHARTQCILPQLFVLKKHILTDIAAGQSYEDALGRLRIARVALQCYNINIVQDEAGRHLRSTSLALLHLLSARHS